MKSFFALIFCLFLEIGWLVTFGTGLGCGFGFFATAYPGKSLIPDPIPAVMAGLLIDRKVTRFNVLTNLLDRVWTVVVPAKVSVRFAFGYAN